MQTLASGKGIVRKNTNFHVIIKFSLLFISMSNNVSVSLFITGICYENHFKQDLIYGIEKDCHSHLIVGKYNWL